MKTRIRIRKVRSGLFVVAFGKKIFIDKPAGTLVKVFRFRDTITGQPSYGFMKYIRKTKQG